MENLIVTINSDIVKKIFGNKYNAIQYLLEIDNNLNEKELKKLSSKEIYKKIVQSWDYHKALKIIRNLFRTTQKYKNGKDGENAVNILINEWQELKLGDIKWPFSQGQFDNFVQQINSRNIDRIIKDTEVKEAAVRYRRIKEINTARNDFLETLIFEKNENIIPTLSHSRGLDFFINGISYDQKVAKSPTIEFKKQFDNWREYAIEHPDIVAKFLYQYQNEGRFGSSPRLFIVYLDEDIEPNKIKELISDMDLFNPLNINFEFKHKDLGVKSYNTKAFVILLYK